MKIGIYCRDFRGANGMTKATVLTARAFLKQGHRAEILAERAESSRRLVSLFGTAAGGLAVRKAGKNVSGLTAGYDLFINQLPGAYFPSFAKRNWLWFHAAPLDRPRHLGFYRILANSRYTLERLRARWGVPAEVLYPPAATADFPPLKKERVILSVGTFGGKARPKNELAMIRLFRDLHARGDLKDWTYHLAGELEGGPAWLGKLKAAAGKAPVSIHVGAGLALMRRLYGRAAILWHACGAEPDGPFPPEGREHFGLALVEGMAAGCVVLAPNAGGPREIISQGRGGRLYSSWEKLGRWTIDLSKDGSSLRRQSRLARKRSRNWNLVRFDGRFRELVAAKVKK